ncbi:MAG: hypothetical protein LC099_08620 [Anaerolineales bacterium]|nr:hypothetical protein [Anaerolineales bacterium]
MENSRAAIAALIFIVVIVGVNLVMYAVVRGFARGGKDDPLVKIMQAVSAKKPEDKADEMDELRKIMGGLNGEDEGRRTKDRGRRTEDRG